MAKAVGLEEGINEAIKAIGASTNRPVMVAVYGLPNSGKTFLIDKIAERLERIGITVSRFSAAPRKATFEAIKADPYWPSQVHLYHCGWNKTENKYLGSGDDDPNIHAMQVLGRRMDLNIGIYNPAFSRQEKRDYDLVIRNPDSTIKPTPSV